MADARKLGECTESDAACKAGGGRRVKGKGVDTEDRPNIQQRVLLLSLLLPTAAADLFSTMCLPWVERTRIRPLSEKRFAVSQYFSLVRKTVHTAADSTVKLLLLVLELLL